MNRGGEKDRRSKERRRGEKKQKKRYKRKGDSHESPLFL
jgi:hypothetical protein